MDRSNTGVKSKMPSRRKEKFYALLYSLVHPFDGFYELKHRGLKSNTLSIIALVLYGLVACIKYQYSGFVVNDNPIHRMNSVQIFFSAVGIFVLFAIANWTITTLFNGKGFISDILMVLGYALYPVIVGDIIYIIASNFIVQEEAMLLYAVSSLIWAWFAFLVLAGLTTVHEYTFSRTLVTIFASVVSMTIIVFVVILYFTLVQQFVSFFLSLIKEIIRRV